MNKKEQALVDAIEAGNKDEAIEALTAFASLKSTTDEQSNDYFDKIQAIGEDEAEVEEILEEIDDSETESDLEEEEVIEEEVAPRVEKRGVKAVAPSRAELNAKFAELLELSVNYFAEVKKDNNAQSKFAKRLVQILRKTNKTIFR